MENAASARSSATGTSKLVELGYESLSGPSDSPDLAPGDFYLFPNMQK